MIPMLEIKDVYVEIDNKEILKGVNLTIPAGETHAIMGPNGSGKSTLSCTIMGHPKYRVTRGDIFVNGTSILNMSVDERARLGVYLCFQYPATLPGVSMVNFLRTVLKNIRGADVPIKEFKSELKEAMSNLEMKDEFLSRYVNDGFSGGEKKRNEILQMALMKPKLAILDEVDSGLDIDALRVIATDIDRQRHPERSQLVITHYQRLLNYMQIDRIHIFKNGHIFQSGGRELAEKLERDGYDWIDGEKKG